MPNRAKTILLVVGDIAILYLSLFLMLGIRYGAGWYEAFTRFHAIPFGVIFILWLLVFFIAGLYDLRRLHNNLDFIKTLWLAVATSAILSGLVFYAVPYFGIAPKTNLAIFVVIFGVIGTLWRRGFNRASSSGEAPNRVLLIGNGPADEVAAAIAENAQLGYTVAARIKEAAALAAPGAIRDTVNRHSITCVVVPRSLKREGHLPATLYQLFADGVQVFDLPNFSEIIMRKVPLSDLEETWFLENIEGAARFYDPLKRAFEFVLAIAIGIALLPFEILIAIAVKLTSPGPVIYRQVRVGKNGRLFTLYKFRTMRNDAERHGAQWAAKGDPRVTPLGRILRISHLDELPQLLNILRGELSFVGPRPERPEFVGKLKEQIPYYETRLLVKPGVTGWAQINHRADLDLEDVKQKLQYDIYYLKNRSLVLDLAIVAKTIKSIFATPQ